MNTQITFNVTMCLEQITEERSFRRLDIRLLMHQLRRALIALRCQLDCLSSGEDPGILVSLCIISFYQIPGINVCNTDLGSVDVSVPRPMSGVLGAWKVLELSKLWGPEYMTSPSSLLRSAAVFNPGRAPCSST